MNPDVVRAITRPLDELVLGVLELLVDKRRAREAERHAHHFAGLAINVDGLEMERLHAQKTGTETLHLERVNKLLLRDSAPLPDQSVDQLNELAF